MCIILYSSGVRWRTHVRRSGHYSNGYTAVFLASATHASRLSSGGPMCDALATIVTVMRPFFWPLRRTLAAFLRLNTFAHPQIDHSAPQSSPTATLLRPPRDGIPMRRQRTWISKEVER